MRSRPLVAAVGLLGLCVGLVQGPAAAAPQTGLTDAKARAEQLRRSLADLRARSAESIVALEQAEDALGRAVTESVSLSRQLDAARSSARGTDEQLKRRVAALYRSGGAVGLYSSLLGASTPTELISRKANVDAVVSADARLRGAAADDSGRLDQLEDRARDGAAERNRIAQEAERRAGEVEASMAQQAALLDAADAEVRRLVEEQRRAAAAAAAKRLAVQQARAAAAAAAAAAQAAVLPPGAGGAPSTGALPAVVPGAYAGPPAVCPVGPVHSFTGTWGAARSGGRKHQGTDVFAPYGSPIYAVVDGVIDKVGNGGLGGITLWLRGDDGDRYYYAHNSANAVQVGQRVRAGQQIASIGTSGNAATTPPHTHFQAHARGGPPADPYPWLAAICAG